MTSTDRSRTWRPRLPVRDMRGDVLITQAAVAAAARLLPTFRGPDGDHEGLVFLLGWQLDGLTLLTTALAPDADHGPGHVMCDEAAVAAAGRAARRRGLGLLAQLHTHPRDGTVHSLGDDDLVLMPFEGMLSLIAPWYGQVGLEPLGSLGVHQYQDGRWVLVDPASARAHLRIVPDALDLR